MKGSNVREQTRRLALKGLRRGEESLRTGDGNWAFEGLKVDYNCRGSPLGTVLFLIQPLPNSGVYLCMSAGPLVTGGERRAVPDSDDLIQTAATWSV